LEETHYYPFGLVISGISSKAANFGNPENTKKYDGYELNTDFDINLYESFYRTHDPQIGRFLQIDPKANDLESPYAAMSNNPISNNDPFGDITHYFNSSGDLLRSQEDGRDYATITAVTDDNLETFNAWAATSDKLQGLAKGSAFENLINSFTAGALSGLGVSYDVNEYFGYYDSNDKDPYLGKDAGDGKTDLVKSRDGKPLYNEHAAGTEIKNGYMRIRQETDAAGNPINSDPSGGASLGVHTHVGEGRKIKVLDDNGQYQNGEIKYGKAAFADDLTRTAVVTNPSAGKFRVGVSPTHVYLYGNGKVLIAVDRKMTPSKNPGEIK
jgi:RHS repeat-associated protein